MGKRRRKNRTHLKGAQSGEDDEKAPKSFVIKSGVVTKSVAALVRDTRRVMEPNTATRLRERPSARLRDYLTIAPTLGVTHLVAYTLTEAANVHLRVARVPQGPTLTFRVTRYSLMKDLVNSALRNVGKSPGGEYRNPPLLVLNNFQQPADGRPMPQLKLMSTMFQGLFPPIQVEKSALPTFRRVLLLSYSHASGLISVRHFIITVRPHGVSRRVRKLLAPSGSGTGRARPAAASRRVDLSNTDDIADYLLRRTGGTPGAESSAGGTEYDSASETDASEAESDTNAVELPEDYVGRGNRKGERKAVRLVETGPRLELRLIKVTEGLVGSKRGEGATVYHHIEKRTKEQRGQLEKDHEARRLQKEARRKEQAANVARKKGKGKSVAEEQAVDDELDVDGLSDDDVDLDMDPEEELEARRQQGAAGGDEDESEFDYEDQVGEDDDDEEWDEDVGAGEVSSEEDDEEDEPAPPPRKRPTKR